MRYLGIDFGTKRIGLALSDESGAIGFPHSVVHNADGAKALDEIAALAAREGVGAIVVGESRDLAGGENPVAAEAKAFAAALGAKTGLPIEWEAEFYTSAAARRAPGQPDAKASRAPTPRGSAARPVDDSAAALILTSYLSRIKSSR